MCYLHRRNIIHCDLSTNNILLAASELDDRGFVAKVSDMGLSRIMNGSNGVINTRTSGTVTHMPPELLMDGDLTKAADVYAFGIILWEIAAGRRPFEGLTHGQIVHRVTSNALPEVSGQWT